MTADSTPRVAIHTNASARLDSMVHEEMSRSIGHLQPRHIVIKPNWVLHQASERSPIAALVTDARVIAAAVRAAARIFPRATQITVGDCPLQRADWQLLCEQSGLTPLIESLRRGDPRIEFRDLRRDAYTYTGGRLVHIADGSNGDPLGYCEVELGSNSHLEDISDRADRFAIHDHDRAITRAKHRRGDHRYLVARTFLDADLIINLPKWKTHSKSGLTGALKNLVGINGDKAYLPHFSRGAPKWGGDEYWNAGRWVFWVQNTGRDWLRSRLWPGYRLAQPFWAAFKAARSAMHGRHPTTHADFYVGGGAWYGNQTIWRMIYDLNMVMQHTDGTGRLHAQPQRHYFCIVDGLVAGEGDGPLFAAPKPVDWLICGEDPFAIDACLAWCMGFDPARLPILANRDHYRGAGWGKFSIADVVVSIDGRPRALPAVEERHDFQPPPGWIGHVERSRELQRVAAGSRR